MMASTLSRLFSRSRPILLRRVSFRSCFPKHTLASSLGSVLEWMNINGYNGRGLVDLPRKHPLAAGLGRAVALQNFEKKLKSTRSNVPITKSEPAETRPLVIIDDMYTFGRNITPKARYRDKSQQWIEGCSVTLQQIMRMVHEKFEEDVGNHLEDFKSAIEGLEVGANQQSRETAKWGSGSSAKSGVVSTPSSKGTSHQKLITHFEGGIETNLNREKTRSNVAKTKREPAETRPQEQQEKLDDVGNHLEDFKSPNEGLEAKHSDLKGSTEKQRTSHQKLIAHSEGGIETNLDSATKRINEASPCSRFHITFHKDFLEKKGDYSTSIHPSMAPSILLVSSLLCHSQHGARGFSSSSSGGDDDSTTPTYQIYEPLSDAEITPKSILFKGCDYRHWLILMEFPKPLPPHDMIYQYESTCGKGLGISLRNARKRIYACSTSTYTGFQAEMKEEESEKFKSLPGVVFVLPDSYLDEDKEEYGGDRYEEGDITPRRRMKFKAGADVWDPQWDAHLFGGGAKKMLTRQEIIERTSPGDDPRPLLAMQDILEDLLELRKKSEVTSGDFARQLHGRAATIDLFSIEGPICQEVVEKLEMLYGFWGSGDAEDKRSTPREDYRERFKGDRRFRGI
ncbi:hypothetical protein Bca52824_050081 [Brassica carinata]|uniref:Uncharacterized protein n=3 Tax=Brassica TaxID=3705 RepID=A0A8X7UTP1_BRACI|nr:hypothetical protein Bca52824_050081 [Brassica carinata]